MQHLVCAIFIFQTRSSVSVLVLGSKFDIMLTRSAIRKTAEFYHGKIVMFDDLTHDMMLDPEWKKVAIVIENFLR